MDQRATYRSDTDEGKAQLAWKSIASVARRRITARHLEFMVPLELERGVLARGLLDLVLRPVEGHLEVFEIVHRSVEEARQGSSAAPMPSPRSRSTNQS